VDRTGDRTADDDLVRHGSFLPVATCRSAAEP
jgi:hypothetical protein